MRYHHKGYTKPTAISGEVKISPQLPPPEFLYSGFQVKIYSMVRLKGRKKSKQCDMKPVLCIGHGAEAVSFPFNLDEC